MRSSPSLLLAVLASSLSLPALAVDGTIGLTGSVVSSTCVISVNGGGRNGVVNLPTIAVSALPVGSGPSTFPKAAGTPFSISLTQCSAAGSVVPMFEAGAGTGFLNNRISTTLNTPAGGGIRVQILNADGSDVLLQGSGSLNGASTATQQGISLQTLAADGAGKFGTTFNFFAAYYSSALTSDFPVGSFTANLAYTIQYY